MGCVVSNIFGLPNLGFGAGLRPSHYQYILENKPAIDWFEIISENYMDTDGRPRRMLARVAEHYPIVMHGVMLSIGSADPLDQEYLNKLKALADDVNPAWISDHLCWTGINGTATHDLLPMPYTEEGLEHVVKRIKQVQDVLGRPLILENPSTYVEFSASQMSEPEFICRMVEASGCGLLMDINNVYVSSYNHGWDAKQYLDAIPADRVVQIHLAGHENRGTHIVDTHDGKVIDEVWQLYRYAITRWGAVSTMVEWDEDIPEFPVLMAEVEKARSFAAQPLEEVEGMIRDIAMPPVHGINHQPLRPLQEGMQQAIVSGEAAEPSRWIQPKQGFDAQQQIEVYIKGYRWRLFDLVSEDYPATRHRLGDERMNALIDAYIEATPPTHFNLANYCYGLADYANDQLTEEDALAQELIDLEKVMAEVFHMPETPAMTPEDVASLDPEAFLTLALKPRAACRLLELEHPANDYVNAHHQEEPYPDDAAMPHYLAVYRHEDTVYRLPLERGEYELLARFQQGANVGEAFADLAELPEEEQANVAANLQHWFSKWVSNGVLASG